MTYVEASQTPPNARDIPPQTLAQIAFEQTDLPEGHLQWNPHLAGDGATVVGMETWVWLDAPVVQIQATAEIPGLSATVTSTFSSIRLHADDAADATCHGSPGTPWTRGATNGCVIVFPRSSAHQGAGADGTPTSTLTATSSWQASWTSTAAPGEHPIGEPQTVTYTAQVPVAEIQTIVTR